MFGRKNWERLAQEVVDPERGKQKKFQGEDIEFSVLEKMRRGRLKTWVSSLLVSVTLNLSALEKMGNLEGDWVMDKYSERQKTEGVRDTIDSFIKIDGETHEDKERKPVEYNKFVSVEDADKNIGALIKVDKDDPLEGLEDLSLRDRERVDIVTFDLRKEYNKGDLSLEDLTEKEKLFDELVAWFIENSKKEDSSRIDIYSLLENLSKEKIPLFDKYQYDENASRLSQVLNKKDSRFDCDGSSLFQLSVLQRVFNYDPSLKKNFEFFKARRSADEEGEGHTFVLILVKNTNTWISLDQQILELFPENEKPYTEAHKVSALISSEFDEAEEEYLHRFEEMPILKPEEVEKFDRKISENVLTREKSTLNLPTYPGNNAEEEKNPVKIKEIKNKLSKEVRKELLPEVLLSPAVSEYGKQVKELLHTFDNAESDYVKERANTEIIELFKELDGQTYVEVAELNPRFAIISLQNYIDRFRGEFGVELWERVSPDKHNIEVDTLPKAITVPVQKDGESDTKFKVRLESYVKLYTDQNKLYQIRALDEINQIKAKYNITDYVDVITKYPDLVKVLDRYEKNGTIKVLKLLVDTYPKKYESLDDLLYMYNSFYVNPPEPDSNEQNKKAKYYIAVSQIKENKDEGLKVLLDGEKEIPNNVILLKYILKYYEYLRDYDKVFDYYKKLVSLGDISLKDEIIDKYYNEEFNDYSSIFSDIFLDIEKQERKFYEEEYSTKDAEGKVDFWESYLETLKIVGGQINEKDLLEMKVLARDLSIIYMETQEEQDSLVRITRILADNSFNKKDYLQSAKYYMVNLLANEHLMPDSHLMEMYINPENIFPSEVVEYLRNELEVLLNQSISNFDKLNNESTSDKVKVKEVIRYYNIWFIFYTEKKFDQKILNFIRDALQNSFYVHKNPKIENLLNTILDAAKDSNYEIFKERAQEIDESVYQDDKSHN